MAESYGHERSDPSYRAGATVFDLLGSKLRRPPDRRATVRRSSLIDKLAREDLRPIVSVVAPAGYGKTTLLSQWAERNGQAFAWVSVDETDNDPKVLLTYVAHALDAVEPIGGPVFDALASPGSSVPGSVVPRLGAAFASVTVPVVLVLDDVHLLRNRECRSALSVLAEHVPKKSRLVLAGRNEPPLRIARLRAEGRITEIGPADLSLTQEEAAALLRAAGLALDDDEVAELYRRTEGWAAGLYLAALYLREGGPVGTAAVSFRGDDRLVSEYMKAEFLTRISRRQRAFLTRTAVLERMSGPLCEAVSRSWTAGDSAPAAGPAGPARLLVPLPSPAPDFWPSWRLEPGVMPVLRSRAAAWCLDRTAEEALEYSMRRGCGNGGRVWQARGTSPAAGGSPRFSAGSGGWMTEAGSRDTRWSRCWPRLSMRGWGDRPRQTGGPMWRTAGGTGPQRSPMTRLSCRGLRWSGPSCADTASCRCWRMRTRRLACSRRRAS